MVKKIYSEKIQIHYLYFHYYLDNSDDLQTIINIEISNDRNTRDSEATSSQIPLTTMDSSDDEVASTNSSMVSSDLFDLSSPIRSNDSNVEGEYEEYVPFQIRESYGNYALNTNLILKLF